MFSILIRHPRRTHVAHLETLTFDDGASSVSFHSPSDRYLVTNRIPPAPPSHDFNAGPYPAICALNPPMHWHSKQTETFHVLKGTVVFYLEGGVHLASQGDAFHIPRAAYHTFRNALANEEMVVEFTLDPSTREQDERLFRNIWSYRDDCRKARIRPSFWQVCMFNYSGNVGLVFPGPGFLARPLARLVNFFGSLIGRWMLGYQDSYEEYYHAKS